MKNLNLRIYRRTLENIALLYNKKALTEEQQKNIEIFEVGKKGSRKLEFITSEQIESVLEEGIIAPDSTVLIMINHEKNNLDPYSDYTLDVVFGDFHQEILVYAFGVLPPTEKDDKKLNIHNYGYDNIERKWVKLPLVRCKDGSYAIPVKLIKE